MKRLPGRRGVAAAVVVVAAVAVGGIAYASIPDANGVIHGCYRKTTGQLIVIDSGGKGCEEGWTPLNWSQTGPTGLTGPTGPTGATGATGATGPTGALSSAYMDAFASVNQVVALHDPVHFDTVLNASGITLLITDFTVPASGVYQVTVDLQSTSSRASLGARTTTRSSATAASMRSLPTTRLSEEPRRATARAIRRRTGFRRSSFTARRFGQATRSSITRCASTPTCVRIRRA
jgi:hypothetical protein